MGYNKAQVRASLVAKYINKTIPKANLDYIKSELNGLYNGIKDGIADGVYIQRGYTVYSVDSGMDNGNLTFGVREKWVIPNKQLREEFIRRRINESISNGHISDGLSSKLRIKYGDNRVRDSGRVLGKELSIDKGQSQNQQRGVPQTNGNKGVQGLTESTSRKSIDVEYINAINNGDTAVAQRMVDQAMETLLGNALEAGRGGVSLEEVEKGVRLSKEAEAKEKTAEKSTGKLATARAQIDVDNFDPIMYTEITLPFQERNRVQSEA